MERSIARKGTFHVGKASLVYAVVALLMTFIARTKEMSFFPEGPAARVAEASRAIWQEGSFVPRGFIAIRDEVQSRSAKNGTLFNQDVFALGKHGELLPKHSWFSMVMGALFYGAFGEPGFWIFHHLAAFLLIAFTGLIGAQLSERDTTLPVLVGALAGTQMIFHIVTFAIDIHAACLVLAALWLAKDSPLLGGALSVLSWFARPALILLLPLTLLFWRIEDRSHTALLRSMVGAAIGAAVVLVTNMFFFGEWFTSIYHHLPLFKAGIMGIDPHPIGFNPLVLSADWSKKLFDADIGLLRWNPILLAFPYVIWRTTTQSRRLPGFMLLLSSALFALYIFSYPMWHMTHSGNRFLFPSIFLFLALAAGDIHRLLVQIFRTRGFLADSPIESIDVHRSVTAKIHGAHAGCPTIHYAHKIRTRDPKGFMESIYTRHIAHKNGHAHVIKQIIRAVGFENVFKATDTRRGKAKV